MDTSFKDAQNKEMQNRTLYQQQLFQQQKDLLTSTVTSQPFHPLQQQSFYFNEPVSEKKQTVQKFDMDIIDDMEETQPSQSIPVSMNQPIQQVRLINQPVLNSFRKSEQSNPQPFRNLQPEKGIPNPQPFQPLLSQNGLSSIRPQSFPHIQPIIKPVANPEHQLVYKSFETYFNNPKFIKTNETNDSFSLYYARVNCMLAEFRYLIVVTDQDNAPKGTIMYLNDLNWKSFQLRILSKEISAPEISYKRENSGLFDDEIKLIKRDKEAQKVMYQCRFNPLIVELLPTKKGSVMDYPDSSTLETAMDTFHCVIYFS